MTETCGGSYKRQPLAWPSVTGTPTFVMPTSATSKPFPRCDDLESAVKFYLDDGYDEYDRVTRLHEAVEKLPQALGEAQR